MRPIPRVFSNFHARNPGRILAPALFLAALLVPVPRAGAEPVTETIQAIKPAIVGVGTVEEIRNPPAQFRGTGFAVGNGSYVITNAHVIPPVLDTEKKEFLAIFTGEGRTAQARKATKVAIDPAHDLVLLKIEGTPLLALKLGDSSQIKEGQQLLFTGYPLGLILGLYPATNRAFVSAIAPIVIPPASSQELNLNMVNRLRHPFSIFQLDATAYPGNSGSPLYDPDTGKVYGIINMVFVKGSKENAITNPSGITYAIPGAYIRALMKGANVAE